MSDTDEGVHVIPDSTLRQMLHRVGSGEDPDMIYAEYHANAQTNELPLGDAEDLAEQLCTDMHDVYEELTSSVPWDRVTMRATITEILIPLLIEQGDPDE